MSDSVTLVDANVVIDGCKDGWLPRLASAQSLAVASTVKEECVFTVSTAGERTPIDLAPAVASGRLRVETATIVEFNTLYLRYPEHRLGLGEAESIAIVLSRGHRFCTSDRAARRAMRTIGIGSKWISLPDLFVESQMDPTALAAYHLRISQG